MDGYLSLEQFIICCKEISEVFDSNWILQPRSGSHPFLKKKFSTSRKIVLTNLAEEESLEGDITEDVIKDDAELPPSLNPMRECLIFECHVVYSESYQNPVLYFNVYTGNGKILKLSEVWENCVHSYYQQNLAENRWSFLTQVEHPSLFCPFYQLHPCHTSDFMQPLVALQKESNNNGSKFNYVASWLSVVLPVIGLPFPVVEER